MTVGLTIKTKKKSASHPGKGDGERFAAKQSLSTSGIFFLPRQVIRRPHLPDNEATVRPIVSTLHGLLNGLPNQPQPRRPPRPTHSPGLKYGSTPAVQLCRNLLPFITVT